MIPILIEHYQSKNNQNETKHHIVIDLTRETTFPIEYSIRSIRRTTTENSSYVIRLAFSFPFGPFELNVLNSLNWFYLNKN
jgi:hypothetical protein